MNNQSETKNCQNCKNQFTIEPDDFVFYERVKVPPPTFCPQCRFQRRIAFRNERKLYKNVSGKSGKNIVALYPIESGVNVYDEKEWYADDWDGLSFGRDYDFAKPFFTQFHQLSKVVPRFNRSDTFSTGSDYCANAGYLKNCYLIFNSNYDENCAYGNGVDNSKECYDDSHINKGEKCYGSFWLQNCYKAHFSAQCEGCTDIWFSKNLKGCSYCFGCVNLVNQKYNIFNQPHSKEDYEKIVAGMNLDTWTGLRAVKEKMHDFWLKFPNKFLQGVKNVNVSGEYITNSKNVKNSYLIREGENLKYVQYFQVPTSKDCMDCSIWGDGNELCYENSVCGYGISNSKFCLETWTESRNLEYSAYCVSCSDCFGCFGLRKKQYCILNKQYSKGDYLALREKIVEHMNNMPYIDQAQRVYKYGEFFPIEHSPFAYNNTLANENFPLSKEEVIKMGFKWSDIPATEYETTMKAEDIPDSIDGVKDDILKELIRCQNCKRAYRLIKPELDFLRIEKIPAPRTCVDCRYKERISQRNNNRIYKRNCMCGGKGSSNGIYSNSANHFHGDVPCSNEFETSYSPERKEVVYCEQCYQAEFV